LITFTYSFSFKILLTATKTFSSPSTMNEVAISQQTSLPKFSSGGFESFPSRSANAVEGLLGAIARVKRDEGWAITFEDISVGKSCLRVRIIVQDFFRDLPSQRPTHDPNTKRTHTQDRTRGKMHKEGETKHYAFNVTSKESTTPKAWNREQCRRLESLSRLSN